MYNKVANFFGYSIHVEQHENIWLKGLKIVLCYNLKDIFLQNDVPLVCHQLSGVYYFKFMLYVWKCKQQEDTLYYVWL